MAAPIMFCFACRQIRQSIRRLHTTAGLAAHEKVRVRFAPSPTGFLHLGGLRTALYNYLFAKGRGGSFILRIEDTDQSRVVEGAQAKLEAMLEWTGVIPDEGPTQGGPCGPYVQSERLELYQDSVETLLQNGTAYHCFCTAKRLDLLRRDAVRRGETPRYDNRCRHLQPAEVKDKLAHNTPFVVRLKLEPTPDPWDDLIKGPVAHNVADIEGDPVLMKSDGYPTYHLANVVDDHHMGITHVLRGDEWQPSTPKHILLYKAFGWQAPCFAHLPLITAGYLPQAVLSYITTIGGGFDCDTSSLPLDLLVQRFQVTRVKRHHGRLDPLFLEESNQKHLTQLLNSDNKTVLASEVHNLICSHFQQRDEDSAHNTVLDQDYLLHVLHWALREDRIKKLADLLQPSLAFLWSVPSVDTIRELHFQHPDLDHLLRDCGVVLQGEATFTQGALGPVLRGQARSHGLSVKDFMHLMRQVLSGVREGPPVAEMMMVMGKVNTLRRLQHCVHLLQASL